MKVPIEEPCKERNTEVYGNTDNLDAVFLITLSESHATKANC